MTVTVHHGDSREVLKAIPDGSVDACVTDAPYALTSILKRFGAAGAAEAKPGRSGVYKRQSAGFMGQRWDTGEAAHDPAFWAEVLRVLKPGAHLVAFSGTRTQHRQVCAIEDAGFEIRDTVLDIVASDTFAMRFMASLDEEQCRAFAMVMEESSLGGMLAWAFGSGFPKSHNQEGGLGTALKPAFEPICLARKPLVGTVAGNLAAHGTGALNIERCRVGTSKNVPASPRGAQDRIYGAYGAQTGAEGGHNPNIGRWPANVVHDGSDEVVGAFPEAPGQQRAVTGDERSHRSLGVYGDLGATREGMEPRADQGSAARFFYVAEPDNLCGLCGCPSNTLSATLSSCNATTAEPSSPTESTPTVGIALSGVAVSPRRGRAGRNQRSSGPATAAESCSPPRHPMGSDTAAVPAPTQPPASLVLNVRSAGNLCASCATAIAQSLAATRRGQDPASLPCPAYIAGRNWQILTSNLALYVAGREHTDTITTTENLKTLLGSVLHAIAATTSSERAGGAASIEPDRRRFHYSSKADAEDRLGSKHPTVKPIDLMAYLCRLVTPPGGVVLDPFAGTGTTGLAAMREGFDAILIEREAQYVADIERRLAWARGEGRLTAQEKARGEARPVEDLPLFGGGAA